MTSTVSVGPPGVKGSPATSDVVTTQDVLSPVAASVAPEPVEVKYANAVPPTPTRTSAATTTPTFLLNKRMVKFLPEQGFTKRRFRHLLPTGHLATKGFARRIYARSSTIFVDLPIVLPIPCRSKLITAVGGFFT